MAHISMNNIIKHDVMVNVKQQVASNLQQLEKNAFSSHLVEDLWIAKKHPDKKPMAGFDPGPVLPPAVWKAQKNQQQQGKLSCAIKAMTTSLTTTWGVYSVAQMDVLHTRCCVVLRTKVWNKINKMMQKFIC